MNIWMFEHDQLKKYRGRLLRFIRLHGDKRIIVEGIRWLARADANELNEDGTAVFCAVSAKKIIGLFVTHHYGLDYSFLVVHRKYRNQHVGRKLLQTAIGQFGKLYGRIALDNIPSLRTAFHSGLVAFMITEGPTGKPTCWVAGGDWSREEVR